MFATKPYALLATTLVLASGLGACADSTSPTGRPVTLAFSTAPRVAASLSPSFAVAGQGVLVITKAQLVLSEVELEPVGASCPNAGEPDDDSCPELKQGPMLVDLPLGLSSKSLLTVNIPAGSYEELEFEIDAVSAHSDDDPQAAAAFLAANPQFAGVSIRVEGTYDGAPFVFTTGVEVEMELEFQPPVAIDASTTGLVIHVDVARWFQAADGTTIDPRTANAGGQNKSKVDENIEKSFDAYEEGIED